jgi:hypothetical protein
MYGSAALRRGVAAIFRAAARIYGALDRFGPAFGASPKP